jgi:DNA-binding LytR/AlgR family response regulator
MLLRYLNAPFTPVTSTKSRLIISVAVSLFVFIFHYVFEPFGIPAYDPTTKRYVIAVYALISLFCLTFNFFLLPSLFPGFFKTESWKVYKEMMWIFWNIFIIALITFFFKTAKGFYPLTVQNLMNVEISALSIGLMPASIYVLVKRLLFFKRTLAVVDPGLKTTVRLRHQSEMIVLNAVRGKDVLSVGVNDVLYLAADHNYIDVHYLDLEGKVLQKRLRSTIKEMEVELRKYPMFFRCHRAFLLNIHQAEAIVGNAKKPEVKLKENRGVLPVSRTLLTELKTRLAI